MQVLVAVKPCLSLVSLGAAAPAQATLCGWWCSENLRLPLGGAKGWPSVIPWKTLGWKSKGGTSGKPGTLWCLLLPLQAEEDAKRLEVSQRHLTQPFEPSQPAPCAVPTRRCPQQLCAAGPWGGGLQGGAVVAHIQPQGEVEEASDDLRQPWLCADTSQSSLFGDLWVFTAAVVPSLSCCL